LDDDGDDAMKTTLGKCKVGAREKETFNYAHTQIRNAIERNFGILKNK
jgi:hypothetical protein